MQRKQDFYTTIELAQMLNVSERTIADAIRNKEILAKKQFGQWYVTHENLMYFISPSNSDQENEEKTDKVFII